MDTLAAYVTVPAITGVVPASAPTGGDELVTITGTGFRGAERGDSGRPTVRVLFDGKESPDVRCFGPTLVTAIAPRHTVTSAPVAVTLLNLDDDGAPIALESANLAACFSYVMPAHTAEHEGDLARILRAILREMKRQLLIDEINYAVQTDYDEDSDDELHVTKFAKLPGITLIGPEVSENRFYSINDEPTFEDPATEGGFVRTRVPYTVDLKFNMIAASDNKVELLNIMSNTIMFFHRNKYLRLDRSATDPSLGSVQFEMDFTEGGEPKSTTVANNSNLRSFSADFVIRGVDIEALSGISVGATGLVPAHSIVERGKAAEEIVLGFSPNPGVS